MANPDTFPGALLVAGASPGADIVRAAPTSVSVRSSVSVDSSVPSPIPIAKDEELHCHGICDNSAGFTGAVDAPIGAAGHYSAQYSTGNVDAPIEVAHNECDPGAGGCNNGDASLDFGMDTDGCNWALELCFDDVMLLNLAFKLILRKISNFFLNMINRSH